MAPTNAIRQSHAAGYPSTQLHERIRWPLLILVVVIGAVIAGLGITLNVAFGWQDIWPSALLGVGITFALGGVLVVLQRALVERVDEGIQLVGQQVKAVEDRTEAIEQEIADRQPISLDDLRAITDSVSESSHRARGEAIASLKADLSFANMAKVLELAVALGAIGQGFRARSSYRLDGVRLSASPPLKLVPLGRRDPVPAIFLSVIPVDPQQPVPKPVDWQESHSVAQVVADLIESCRVANIESSPPAFDPQLGFRGLIDALDLAIRVRQGDGTPRFRGALIEVIDETWCLTTAGLEARFQDVFVPQYQLVRFELQTMAILGSPTPVRFLLTPDRPADWLSVEDWARVVRVAHSALPLEPPTSWWSSPADR
jgi:hypothetical protein